MMNITFPDGSVREYEKGSSAISIAKSISNGLAKTVLAAKVNEEVWDLTRPIEEDASLQLLTWEDEDAKKTFWHSSAHLMAEALEAIYPGVKLGIGPAIDNGFYYDIDLGEGRSLSLEDLPKIEAQMKKLAKNGSKYIRKDVSKADAIAYFKEKGDEYKLELLEGLNDGEITFYTQGNFTDLCRGPHIPGTGQIKAMKLLNVAGAYWRGDESRKQMTRIYGVSFPNQEELDHHLAMLEEAKKRDHRKLGAELELFMFSEKVGAGLPIWLPKGTDLRERLSNFLRNEQVKRGYLPVITPHIGKKELYVTSGHYAKYGEDSFQPIHTPKEDEEFLLKPMNCPHHCEIYANVPKSYRDLPYRVAEFGTVYRYEQSGELHGLTRVRSFTQDDAHIFCTQDQLKDEFLNVLDLTKTILEKLSFSNYTAQISLRDPDNPDKYIGSASNWDKAERAIIEATQEVGLKTVTAYGEAAFYGPKLDFMIKDALGRSWQLGTIQVDYNLPERFELEYIGADNEKHRPVMIHRAPFGSLERFIGVLIEHTGGKFPLWLAPEQVAILPISDKFVAYADEVRQDLMRKGFRARVDYRVEKIGRKIRDAETSKIPYMLIVGEKEMENKEVAVRKQAVGDLGSQAISDFMQSLSKELESE
ncbi:MAG: threonine--tRNA ligase [Chitinophagales bacterium]|nr:threonine--tRNA ligase [Chitinophagales bacterium]